MPKIVGGGYSALTGAASQTDDVMVIVDIHDTTEDSTGTTKTITLANLAEGLDSDTDTDIQPAGAQSAGAGTLVANSQHVHPALGAEWVPSDNGFLAANVAPGQVTTNTLTAAGNLYLLKIWIRQPFTATNLWVNLQAAGTGASTQSFIGIWSSTGTLLTGSSDVSGSYTGTGPKSAAWTTPQALTVAMGWVWVGFVFNYATTQPNLRRNNGDPSAWNAGLTAAQFAVAVNGTSVTALSSITPSSNSQGGNANPYWVGIT